MSDQTARPVRFVIIHRPGPKWQIGTDFREQAGIREHVRHYSEFQKQGKLELGGPFLLPDIGGMKISTKAVSQQEMDSCAAADLAAKSGLLTFEVRSWLTVMERDQISH